MAHADKINISVVQVRNGLCEPFDKTGMKRVVPKRGRGWNEDDLMLVKIVDDQGRRFLVDGIKLNNRMTIGYQDGHYRYASWTSHHLPFYDFGSPIGLPPCELWECESFWLGKRSDDFDWSAPPQQQQHGLILIKEGCEQQAWDWLVGQIIMEEFFSICHYGPSVVKGGLNIGKILYDISPERVRSLDFDAYQFRIRIHLGYPDHEHLLPLTDAFARWTQFCAKLKAWEKIQNDWATRGRYNKEPQPEPLPINAQAYHNGYTVIKQKMFWPLYEQIVARFMNTKGRISSADALTFLIEHQDKLIYPDIEF
jgi:hypothetical protein